MTQFVVIVAVFVGTMWLLSTFTRRQQQRAADEHAQRVEEAMVPGTWVRTTSGFYGKVVEADGDVVTLATPLGDETLWAKRAIAGAEEPPFDSAASFTDEDEQDEDGDETDEVDSASEASEAREVEGAEGAEDVADADVPEKP